MANDNLTAGLAGGLNAVSDILQQYLGYRLRQRGKQEDMLNELKLYKEKLPLQEDSTQRLSQVNIPPDIGADFGIPSGSIDKELLPLYTQREAKRAEIGKKSKQFITEDEFRKRRMAGEVISADNYQIVPDTSESEKTGSVPSTNAGTYTLAQESVKNIDDIKKILFPDGTPKSFRRDVALKSRLPLIGSLPNSKEGQDVFRKASTSISARQLISTGVAARPDETKSLYKAFVADALSNPDSAFNALNELSDFYKNYTGTLTSRKPSDYKSTTTFDENSINGKFGLPVVGGGQKITGAKKRPLESFYK